MADDATQTLPPTAAGVAAPAAGSSLTPTHGVLLVLGTSFALLVALGVIFRR
ncbi:MAG: hypothetical protein KGI89_15670 [Euryarchaeota archaeon]|nr:hypothetical protein [Euryarchaeota archaeon]